MTKPSTDHRHNAESRMFDKPIWVPPQRAGPAGTVRCRGASDDRLDGHSMFAICMVAALAWPLWSANDAWILAFAGVGVVVTLPVVLGPSVRATLEALKSSSVPSPDRK